MIVRPPPPQRDQEGQFRIQRLQESDNDQRPRRVVVIVTGDIYHRSNLENLLEKPKTENVVRKDT